MTLTTEKSTENEDNLKEVEKNWPQILAILIGSLSGFTEGLYCSWTSPFIVRIVEDSYYNINEEQASLFNTITPIAFIVGCPIFSTLSDKVGRKKTFLLTAILHTLGWLFTAFANDIYLFYASRACAGLTNSCFYAVFPIYVGEIANPIVRGSWGNLPASSIYVGQLAITVIGSFCGVRLTSYICLPLPVIFFVLFSFMPESPYFYIMKNKEEEAKKSLRFFTRKRDIEKEYLKLKNDVSRQMSESASWSDLMKIKSNRRALIAGTFLRFSQLSSGLGVFFVFTQTIFEKAGSHVSRELSSIIYMSANVVLNIIVIWFVVHRFSRKKLYIVSISSSGLILYILGTYFYIDENLTIDLSSFRWLPFTGIMMTVICASFGICVIPTLMMSELFSASIKAKAMTFLLIFMGVGSMLTNGTFYYLVTFFGFHSPFYLYAVCDTVAAVLSFYLIPKTKGKTLEEIQQILKRKKNNNK